MVACCVLKPYFLSQCCFFFKKEFQITTNVVIMTCILWQFLKDSFMHCMVFNAIQSIQQVFYKQQNFGSLNTMDLVVLTIISSPELKAQVSLSVNFYIFDFFSRTTRPILTRFGTNHPLGKWIQVFFQMKNSILL